MGLIKGTYKVAENFCQTNLSAGEFWKHFPAYVTFAAIGYFLGSGGCTQQTPQKVEQSMPETVKESGIQQFFEKYR